jgi:hypothetical protein
MNDSLVTSVTGGEIDELSEVGGPGVPHPTRLCSSEGIGGVLDGDFVRRLHLSLKNSSFRMIHRCQTSRQTEPPN